MTTNEELITRLKKNSVEFLTDLKKYINNVVVSDQIETAIKRMDDDVFVMNFGDTAINNIQLFENEVIKDFDTSNHYTPLSVANDEQLFTNFDVMELLSDNIRKQVYLFPDVDINLFTLLKLGDREVFDLFKKLKLYNKYFTVCKKLIIRNQSQLSKEDIENVNKEKIFDDVKEHVKGLKNNGLNTAVNEVISELGSNNGFEGLMAQGMNNITSGKVINMAKRVAGNLSKKVESGEVDISELVDGSKSFINDIMNSPMFNNHPESSNIKNMFSELLNTVEELGDAHKENTESKDIDTLLGIED